MSSDAPSISGCDSVLYKYTIARDAWALLAARLDAPAFDGLGAEPVHANI